MSLSYRARTEQPTSLPRKAGPTTQQRIYKASRAIQDRLSTEYSVKQSAYNQLHQELLNTEDAKYHDLFMSKETDNKIVELTYLREQINELAADPRLSE